MMGLYLPKVGDVGFYGFKAPYEHLQTTRIECIRVSRLSELGFSIDVQQSVYAKIGLEQDVYDEASEKDIQIALMIQSDGNEIYIPVNYFTSYVQSSIVEYKTETLCIDIGAIPKSLSTEHVLNEMKTLASQLVGKELECFIVEGEVVELITQEIHDTLEQERLINVNAEINPYKTIQELTTKVAKLEEYIRFFESNTLE